MEILLDVTAINNFIGAYVGVYTNGCGHWFYNTGGRMVSWDPINNKDQLLDLIMAFELNIQWSTANILTVRDSNQCIVARQQYTPDTRHSVLAKTVMRAIYGLSLR